MIKLGKLTDYAVVILAQLGREGDAASCSASHLAARTGLPEPTVAKILKKLSQEKMVASARGATGGYKLARPPANISVREIIEAMDGPIAITTCVDSACATETLCPAKGKWTPVNNAIRMALQMVTLADMSGGNSEKVQQIVNEGLRANIK